LPLSVRSPSNGASNETGPSDALLRRVLVVDDNQDAADSLAALLKLIGADVQIAYNGAAALEACVAYKPAVVILDIGMPDMDGHEVARRIRRQPHSKDVTLIALTGWGQEEDRRSSTGAGFDAHLVKPVDLHALTALLASCRPE
jgi:CheY-like chemotaxis protein